jgi:Putative prokaryotic signal transducing protein
MAADAELVVVATFLNRIDAEVAQGALEAADIESIVQADDAGGMRPHLWMGGVHLLVRAADQARARKILSN